MRHLALPRFWQHYRRLPREVQELADKSFDLLKTDPYHPSLHFKKIGGAKQLWSVRVGAHYQSGGMFVQSAHFVRRHQGQTGDVSIYGQERVVNTVRLCNMNLAVHGLEGDVRQGNSYYGPVPAPQRDVGCFDFVMANSAADAQGSDREIRR